jgi:ankyrin repeat protein
MKVSFFMKAVKLLFVPSAFKPQAHMFTTPRESVIAMVAIALLLAGCRRAPDQGEKPQIYAEEPDTATIAPLPDPAISGEALLQAALDGNREEVGRLLAAGTTADATDQEGHTPLMLAAFNGHSSIVLELINHGAEVDRREFLGRTALLYASTGPFPETVKILLDKGAEPNIVDSGEHFSPLMHAAAEGNLDVVKILVEYGADPGLRDKDGDNAESFARQAGHLEVANYLRNLQ